MRYLAWLIVLGGCASIFWSGTLFPGGNHPFDIICFVAGFIAIECGIFLLGEHRDRH